MVDYGKFKGFCSFSEQALANAFSQEDRMPTNIDCFVVDSFTSKGLFTWRWGTPGR